VFAGFSDSLCAAQSTRCPGFQLFVQRVAVICFIADYPARSLFAEAFTHGALDEFDFVRRSTRRVNGKRKTKAVCHCHELRTLTPLGLADTEPPFLAETKVPSMKVSDKSNLPRSSKSWAKVSNTFFSLPSLTHVWKRRWQVWYGGNLSGKSDQRAPERNIHNTPFITSRSSRRGLPRVATLGGLSNNGSIKSHCSSVSSSRRAIPEVYQTIFEMASRSATITDLRRGGEQSNESDTRLFGENSYQKDLPFDLMDFLRQRLIGNASVEWLDLCCGEGRALIEAATFFARRETRKNLPNNLRITGIDLAGMFRDYPAELTGLKLLELPVEDFEAAREFDLITCVHGLHYLGDKLLVIQKAAAQLKEDGLLLANLELKNLKSSENKNSKRLFSGYLRKQGFEFDSRKRLLTLKGKRIFELPFEFSGADDRAGSNYTGQPAVDSYYKITTE
jgi:SAM-dependent methyltransferase